MSGGPAGRGETDRAANRPPRWVEAVLARSLGESRAAEVLADLAEMRETRSDPRWTLGDSIDAIRLSVLWAVLERARIAPRIGGWHVASDLRHAFRTIRRTPGASASILATLALSVGVTTALFTVVDAVLLRGLPFPNADRLALLYETAPVEGRRSPLAPPTLDDYRDGMSSFDRLGGWASERYTLTGRGEPIQILGVRATADLFSVLGITPARGRTFRADDEADRTTVVLSHAFWQARFGGDPDVLGRTLTLDDTPHEVVGVMPAGFLFPDDDEIALWLPHTIYPWERQRWTRTTSVIGRLAEGATVETATAEAASIAAGLAEAHPRTNEGWGAEVAPARALIGDQSSIAILAGMVLLVLLIAVSNVANLFAVRAEERTTELSVRAALGAGRGAQVRLLLTESLVYGVLGVVGGAIVARVSLQALLALEPGSLPRWNPVTLDLRALVFTAAVGIGAALIAGLWPSLRMGRRNLVARAASGRSPTGGHRVMRRRSVLSSFEVALAVVLTTGASLLVASLLRLRAQDPGFEAEGLLAATVELPQSRYDYESGRIEQAFDDIRENALRAPGVVDAGWVTALPMSPVGTDYDIEFFRVDRPIPTPGDTPPTADFRVVSEGYLETLGLPLLAGRGLENDLTSGAPGSIVVNRALVDRYFPGEDPLGKSLRLYEAEGDAYEIVGVVGNVRHRGLDDASRPEIYVEFHRMAHDAMTLLVRTRGDPGERAGDVVAAVRAVDPDLPVLELRSMSSLIGDTMAERRFQTSLLLAFAALGLVLALIGVHGTLAHSVSRRTREIGVRMAVGAGRARVVREVLGRGARVVGLGLAVGLAGSLVGSRLLRSLLYGIQPDDPRVLAAVCGLVGLVALAATLFPALRAARIDPVEALKQE